MMKKLFLALFAVSAVTAGYATEAVDENKEKEEVGDISVDEVENEESSGEEVATN